MLEDLFNCTNHSNFTVVRQLKQCSQRYFTELVNTRLIHPKCFANNYNTYIAMLKYFLEEEEHQPSQTVQNIIKTHHIYKREYTPFHLDCQYTKKKLCYCSAFAVNKMAKSNKTKIWQSYQPVHDFYTKIDQAEVQKAKKLYHHCRDKIRKLSKSQIAEFVRNLRSEKNLHMGQNGQYENV